MKCIVWPSAGPLNLLLKFPVLILSCGILACKPQARKLLATTMRNAAIQEKEINNIEVAVTYMPACLERKQTPDNTQLVFRLSMHPGYDDKPQHVQANATAQYDIDTMLLLIAGTDTILPLYMHRTSTGDMLGKEYLVGFDRSRVSNIPALHLVVRNWQADEPLRFIYERSQLQRIDELSCN